MSWRGGVDEDGTAGDGLDAELSALRSRIDLVGLPPLTRAVTEQVIASTAEVSYAQDLVCSEPWLEAAVGALAAGAPVVADGPVVTAGIASEITICKSGESLTERLSRTAGIARAAAAVRLAFGEAGPGAIWVVGEEPVAIFEIIARSVEPTLVVAMPAGFVAAVEAKRTLRDSGLPVLTNASEKGGPVAAAAACRVLIAASRPAGQPVSQQRTLVSRGGFARASWESARGRLLIPTTLAYRPWLVLHNLGGSLRQRRTITPWGLFGAMALVACDLVGLVFRPAA